MKPGKKKQGGNVKPLVMQIAIAGIAVHILCGLLSVTIMAKASRAFTGGRQSIGNPTLSRNSYFQMIKMIRREREKVAEAKAIGGEVREGATNN